MSVLALTADRARRGIAKMDSMASELERLTEIAIVAINSYNSSGVVLRDIKI